MQRCSKRSLTFCRNRVGQNRYCVCGKPEGHGLSRDERDPQLHACAWCEGDFVQAQTSEGGA